MKQAIIKLLSLMLSILMLVSAFTACGVNTEDGDDKEGDGSKKGDEAVSEGEREFEAIAVAGGKNGVISGVFPPCGVCRQVMAEFCPSEFKVLFVKSEGEFEEHTLGELLPCSFGLE